MDINSSFILLGMDYKSDFVVLRNGSFEERFTLLSVVRYKIIRNEQFCAANIDEFVCLGDDA